MCYIFPTVFQVLYAYIQYKNSLYNYYRQYYKFNNEMEFAKLFRAAILSAALILNSPRRTIGDPSAILLAKLPIETIKIRG